MPRWVVSQSHVLPAFRPVASLVAGLMLAGIGGLVLGEYTFQGVGIQWLAISGGGGLGAAVARVLNRGWAHDPPLWMAAGAARLAAAGGGPGRPRGPGGLPRPPEGGGARGPGRPSR